MNLKSVIRNICPPLIWKVGRSFKPSPSTSAVSATDRIVFSGDYASWEEAERASTGYAATDILAKTREGMLKVKNGEAAFERDSVTFDVIQYEFPLLAGLLRVLACDGRLSVLDFGGALGSSYFQCRRFLTMVKELRWSIVEQPAHVACGRAEFTDEHLRFYKTIDECIRSEQPNVLLLSGVVQCLPKPYDFLAESLQHEFSHVIVDRTAFMRNDTTRLTVEHVPEQIYKASYPSWFLSEQRFLECFHSKYRLVASFIALDKNQPEGGEADCKGFIFELIR